MAYGEFNGIPLYSDTVTLDEACIKITGKTKAEHDKIEQEMKDNLKKQEKEYQEKIPKLAIEYINKGKKILTEDKWEYWEKIVPIRLNGLYEGIELKCCLDIVEILNNNGTIEEANEKFESQCHSIASSGLVCSIIKDSCSRGSDFVDFILKTNLNK